MLLAVLPVAIAVALIKSRGWRTDSWSERERRWRAWLSVMLGLAFGVAGFFVVVIGAWLLGPDCGVEPTSGVRTRIALFGIVVALAATAVPVAIAGQRRLALLAAAAPAIAPLVVTIASATSSQPGWCLF